MTARSLERCLGLVKAWPDATPAATAHDVMLFEAALGIRVSPGFRLLYRTFNGVIPNLRKRPGNHIELWSLGKIVLRNSVPTTRNGRRYFGIGDLLILSHITTACLEDETQPVLDAGYGMWTEDGLAGFLNALCSGKYDF